MDNISIMCRNSTLSHYLLLLMVVNIYKYVYVYKHVQSRDQDFTK